MFKNYKKGFTLIELIVVMVIIGVLVLLAVPK
jgi:prepilin-type N-terminal cleavage/methylation domain-containing protein